MVNDGGRNRGGGSNKGGGRKQRGQATINNKQPWADIGSATESGSGPRAEAAITLVYWVMAAAVAAAVEEGTAADCPRAGGRRDIEAVRLVLFKLDTGGGGSWQQQQKGARIGNNDRYYEHPKQLSNKFSANGTFCLLIGINSISNFLQPNMIFVAWEGFLSQIDKNLAQATKISIVW